MSSADDTVSLVQAFKSAMRRLASTVTIVSTRDGQLRSGMTATAVTSLCADPPSLLICVNRSASIRRHVALGARLCVNLLSSPHMALSSAFSGGVEPERRFDSGTWLEDEYGIPYLANASSSIFGTVDQLIEYGTHSILICRVYCAFCGPANPPIVYGDGRILKTI